jgi:hypothetical protein
MSAATCARLRRVSAVHSGDRRCSPPGVGGVSARTPDRRGCACTRTTWCERHRAVLTPTQRASRGPVVVRDDAHAVPAWLRVTPVERDDVPDRPSESGTTGTERTA